MSSTSYSSNSTMNNTSSSKIPIRLANDQQFVVKSNEGFVKSDIEFYCKVAKATYYLKSRMDDHQRQRICQNGISHIMFSCSRFFIAKAKESNEIVVAFRGSTRLRDWLLGFTFVPKPVGGDLYAHTGISRGGDKLLQKRDLLKELDSAIQLYPNSQVVFVGHSLGGSIASYLGWYITQQRPELKISVYTFGAFPWTSNPTEGQNLSVINFVNKLDPVPRGSWERMSGAFRYDSTRNRKGFRRPMHLFGKTVMLQDDVELGGFFKCFKKGAGLSDHWMSSYSNAVKEWFADAQTGGETEKSEETEEFSRGIVA